MVIKIDITDPEDIDQIDSWLADNCQSVVGWELLDVSDVTIYYDSILTVSFSSEDEAVLFALRWAK